MSTITNAINLKRAELKKNYDDKTLDPVSFNNENLKLDRAYEDAQIPCGNYIMSTGIRTAAEMPLDGNKCTARNVYATRDEDKCYYLYKFTSINKEKAVMHDSICVNNNNKDRNDVRTLAGTKTRAYCKTLGGDKNVINACINSYNYTDKPNLT
jgi:hypothetical protein